MTERLSRVVARRDETVLAIPGKITPTSLVLRPGLPYEKWEGVGKTLRTIEGAVQWWLGDWLNYGEAAYGEKYAQAVNESQARTWQAYSWVASRYKITSRLVNVDWSTHQALACIEDLHGKRWVLVQVNGTDWVPSFQQLFWIVNAICRCEDEKYPQGEGWSMVASFLADCCKPGATWDRLATRYELCDEDLALKRQRSKTGK